VKRILGLLGWLGVLLVVAAVVLRFLRPELDYWYRGLAMAGLVVTAVYALSQWRDIGRSFQGRRAKYGSIAASSALLVLAILAGINWVSSRQNKRWDLTTNKQFSLSDQTKKILTSLTKPVVLQVFYQGSPEPYRANLSEYQYLSSQLTVNYLDVNRERILGQKYTITSVPTVIVEYDGRTEKATSTEEQAISNALKKLIEGRTKKLYFVEGHGERDPTGSDPNGYSGIADSLKTDNFDVAKLNIAQQGKVPDDATVVVIAGPTVDYLAPEVDALRAYLGRGGKLAILLDPPSKADAPEPKSLIALAKEWGIDVGSDLVLDTSGLGQMIGTDATVPIAMPVPHPITDKFRVMTAFPLARSVTPVEGGTGGHVAQKVAETSPQSWAESDLKGLFETRSPTRDLAKGDKAGPVAIMSAVSAAAPAAPTPAPPTPPTEPAPDAPKPETRMVVVGDSDFESNAAINIQGNRDLFLNMANWLAQQEDLIAIRPKDPDNRSLTMTADQAWMVYLFSIAIVPLLLFGNAVRVWWKKR
jgi:ABC-type uncharacterized transport system involved in gliding motility auxiliary subunit